MMTIKERKLLELATVELMHSTIEGAFVKPLRGVMTARYGAAVVEALPGALKERLALLQAERMNLLTELTELDH